jgi:Na+-translocating ferredoxin:NAD+ oxidoreductase RnfG subunit
MMNKILAVLTAIGAFFSAIFFVLFKQKNEEKKFEQERAERAETSLDAEKNAQKKENEVKKENEKEREKINSGNNLDTFNAVTDILSK